MGRHQFDMVVVVWGDEFTRLFTNSVLRTHLSPGNLPVFKRDEVRYSIYTTAMDARTVENSEAYKHLKSIFECRIIIIGTGQEKNKHAYMTQCHQKSIRDAFTRDAAIVFLPPDAVFADGSLARMRELSFAGIRAVMVPGLRVFRENFPSLLEDFSDGVSITVGPRELMRLAKQELHEISKLLIWGHSPFSIHPSHLYFELPNGDLLGRCFHLHPMLVHPRRKTVKFDSTIDGDFILNARLTPDQIHIVEDSDDIFCVEMSPVGHFLSTAIMNRCDTRYVAQWADSSADKYHLQYVNAKIRMHEHDISPEWEETEARSNQTIEEIQRIRYQRRIFFAIRNIYYKAYLTFRLGLLPKVIGKDNTDRLVESIKKRVRWQR